MGLLEEAVPFVLGKASVEEDSTHEAALVLGAQIGSGRSIRNPLHGPYQLDPGHPIKQSRLDFLKEWGPVFCDNLPLYAFTPQHQFLGYCRDIKQPGVQREACAQSP